MEPIMITADILSSAIGGSFSVPLLTRLADAFKAEEEILIEWTSPNYVKVEIFFGFVRYERGERCTFRIRGKPGFAAEAIKHLSSQGTILERKRLSR